MGLAIAKDIIALHGGIIRFESDNQHTVFKVELPRELIAEKAAP